MYYNPMAVITMRIDDVLKKKMESMKDVNWSEVARKAIEEKIREAELWERVDVVKLREASKDTDSLRRTVEGWNSTEEIRRWRDRDHPQ
jgi:hypothetical protein